MASFSPNMTSPYPQSVYDCAFLFGFTHEKSCVLFLLSVPPGPDFYCVCNSLLRWVVYTTSFFLIFFFSPTTDSVEDFSLPFKFPLARGSFFFSHPIFGAVYLVFSFDQDFSGVPLDHYRLLSPVFLFLQFGQISIPSLLSGSF